MAVTRLMTREPMPWQADIFDVAFELDPVTGMLWYSEIVIVVPRQSGKTTLVIPWGVHRCTTWPERQFMVYTAQTRDKALKKLVEEQFYWINRSPFRRLLTPNRSGKILPRLSNGSEHLAWANGSRWSIDAPTEDAGHGDSLGLTVGDEIYAQRDARLEAAFLPATTAVPDAQSIWISTVGKAKESSPFLWGKVEAGRNRVDLARMDPRFLDIHRTLYVEYSAPADADWLDPMTWWETMPALGYTTTQDKIAGFADAMQADDGATFRRAYLNQWRGDLGADWKIPRAKWQLRLDSDSQVSDLLTWVIDISPDRGWASIGVASLRPDGLIHIEVVDDGPGTDWLIEGDPDRELAGIRHLVNTHGGEVWYDHLTVGGLAPDLRDAGIHAEPIESRDVMVAAGNLKDHVLNGRVRHIGQTELDDALASAATSTFGDGWKWARGRSLAPITGLVSVSLALRMLAKRLPDLNYDALSALSAQAGR